MFTLSLRDQATVDQKQIVTVLFRPESVCAAGVWHTDGLKCPGLVTMGLYVANHSLEAHLVDFGMHPPPPKKVCAEVINL